MSTEGLSFLDASGYLWYGTWGLGLYRVNLASNQVKNYRYGAKFGADCVARSIVPGEGWFHLGRRRIRGLDEFRSFFWKVSENAGHVCFGRDEGPYRQDLGRLRLWAGSMSMILPLAGQNGLFMTPQTRVR